MTNTATDILKKLYVDVDGFTKSDCYNYLQIIQGAPLGNKEEAERHEQCTAITEYVRVAEGDSSAAAVKSAIKLLSTKISPKLLGVFTAVDWREALKERLPFLFERLTNQEGPCGLRFDVSEDCVPYIDDIAKLGPYGAITAGQLMLIAVTENSLSGIPMAHARVALEKVAELGKVEERVKGLANIIPRSDIYKKRTLAEEAAAYASFPQYTKAVNDAFAPLLSDKNTFMFAVTAIAGGGERSKDMVPQILDAAPTEDQYFDGDELMHKLEKVLDYDEIRRIRKLADWECYCW